MKNLLLIGLLILVASPAAAQPALEISPFVGYLMGGKVDGAEGQLEIQDEMDWGVMMDITIVPRIQLELGYSRQDTHADFVPRDGSPTEKAFDLGVNYFNLGVNYAIFQEKLAPFLSFGLGSTHWDPQGVDAKSRWQFSIVFGGGAKYYFNDHFGIRTNLRIYSTFVEQQGPLYCAPFAGCVNQIEGGSLMQLELSAGLVLGF